MEYPHRRYLFYLLSRKFTPFEIMADCTDKELLPPTEDDLISLTTELGPAPKSWRAKLTGTNISLRRWLRNKSLLPLWANGTEVREAKDFLHSGSVRKDFEALMVIHGDVSPARSELLLKYPANRVPNVEALEQFCLNFWSLGEVSNEGLFTFLRANQARAELIPAVRGDLSATYGRLGLRQKIEADQFYDNIIALANQQVEYARRQGNHLNGSTLMGIAALTRQAIDAIAARDALHIEADGGSAIDAVREQAMAFKMRLIQEDEIPSFEDIEEDVIDVEYTEQNVRQFNAG